MDRIERGPRPFDAELAKIEAAMPATTDICVALVIALVVYLLGCALYQREAVPPAPMSAVAAGAAFLGP